MQTFLIISSDESIAAQEIEKLMQHYAVSSHNFSQLTPDPSHTIESIRKFQKQMTLKSLGGGKRIYVIKQAEKATIQAQNALLKTLEEPPLDTYIILTSRSKELLLPTIVSRSQIITPTSVLPDSQNDKTIQLMKDLLQASAGERVLKAQEYTKTKDEALALLDDLLTAIHHGLHGRVNLDIPKNELGKLCTKISMARTYIQGNINIKATMDILFMGFPRK